MILSAIVAKLKQRARADFRGRHYIVQAVSWYLLALAAGLFSARRRASHSSAATEPPRTRARVLRASEPGGALYRVQAPMPRDHRSGEGIVSVVMMMMV